MTEYKNLQIAEFIKRHLAMTPMLPVRVDEMRAVEAAIFAVAAYHNGFLQFLLRHLEVSSGSTSEAASDVKE